jgi:hypothetical protein
MPVKHGAAAMVWALLGGFPWAQGINLGIFMIATAPAVGGISCITAQRRSNK